MNQSAMIKLFSTFRACPTRQLNVKSLGSSCTAKRFSSTSSNSDETKTDPSQANVSDLDQLYRFVWLKCQAHETATLDSYEKFCKMAAENLDLNYVRTEEPLRVIRRRTMLASRHVHKKYRAQYEVRTYFRHLLFKNLTESTANTFLEYVERNLPEGVLMIVEKHRLSQLPEAILEADNPTN